VARIEQELNAAWQEVSFWQDYVMWWKAEHNELPEPRVMEALENAWRRYEQALELRRRSIASDQQPSAQATLLTQPRKK
jgi:hypothetical protein